MLIEPGRMRWLIPFFIAVLSLLVAGCRDDPAVASPTPETGAEGPPVILATDVPALTPVATASSEPGEGVAPTAAPTDVPTPTPTAAPILIDGDPLTLAVRPPTAVRGAPCGVIDRLDFPLDPPDGESISRGGQDFGRFRRRFDGYHAGEDWWGSGPRGSFGSPVYSIGHGQVTYAQPLGWGVDQGVVIVRHIDESGRTFYSFYGHLDPPSVQLRGNDCVARGDVIGKIGRPRGSPHLHFEIRTHMPGEPGPGYWGTDPRSAGWLAPSATIWDQRHRLLPGYVWSRSFAAEGTLRAGSVDAATQILLEQSSLIGLSDEDGTEHWRVRLVRDDDAPEVTTAVNDAALPQVYVADRFGRIAAYHIPADADETNGQASGQVWELQMENVRGTPTLIALPEGGVAFVADERIIGFSPRGAILWRHQFLATPLDFLPWDGEVIITTSGSGGRIWSLSAARALRWNLSLSGQLVQAGNGAFLYGDGGVYRLDADTQQASLLYRLPNGVFSQGDMVSLPNGGLLLSHLGAGGRRLMALGADGSLQWERSYAGLLAGFPRFAVSGGEVYLIVQEVGGSWSRVAVYALMVDDPSLTLLMVGGTRSPIPGDTWATAPREDRLLVNIGGGDLVALDPKAAAKEVCAAGPALACPPWTARGPASPPELLPQ